MKLFKHAGAHRAVLSAKARIAAIVSVAAIVFGGGVVAVSAANAAPLRSVTVMGVAHCFANDLALQVHYTGNNGDSGTRGVDGRNIPGLLGSYWFPMTRVQPGGEWTVGSVDCRSAKDPRHFYPRPFAFTVPDHGTVFRRNLP